MEEKITIDPKDAEDNKVMAILAYFNILVLVPILGAKESPFARFHANQGLILFLASIALGVVGWVLMLILVFVSPFLVTLVYGLTSIVSLVILVLAIIGIINAVKGEAKELPLVGKIKILK